ncbi:MAG TPA: SUKH-4 family immunity protein [Blastocatellia bacterium]|nr:SUKH-4 family immunity protein [Blastocatellia bacterium]
MKPAEFVAKWNQLSAAVSIPELSEEYKLLRLSPERAAELILPEDAKRFLMEAGLPKSAAPFLSMDEVGEGLPHIWETWDTSAAWKDEDRLRLNRCLPIGSDHEDLFHTVTFVNSSVPQFAHFLLLFDSYLTSKDPKLVEESERIDARALTAGAFWRCEFDTALDES